MPTIIITGFVAALFAAIHAEGARLAFLWTVPRSIWLIGYRVAATDGELGEVEDLIIDDDVWSLTEIEIATPNGWLARTVRVPADALYRIDWSGQTIHVRMKRSEIEALPDVAA